MKEDQEHVKERDVMLNPDQTAISIRDVPGSCRIHFPLHTLKVLQLSLNIINPVENLIFFLLSSKRTVIFRFSHVRRYIANICAIYGLVKL
ncbi:hypothetical protein ACH3XW_22350 [Acanthocheilonema viteae]